MDKSAGQKTCLPNQKCKFTVRIANQGLGDFKGPLTISDRIKPASERLTDFGPDPWKCVGGDGEFTCRHPETELKPGQSILLSLGFESPEKSRGTVENCARIDWETPPLEGICSAAIEQALARERETMDDKTRSETEKAFKEFQCKAGVDQTGKPDAQLLRMAFKSIGMGDTNRDNDISCAVSSVDIPLLETVGLTPESTECTGGRVWNVRTRKCACPPDKPNWAGLECTRDHVYETTEPCTGGRFRSKSTGECLCPSRKPAWDGKQCQPRGLTAAPPPSKPAPSAAAPSTPTCTGGRYWDPGGKTCRCPSHIPNWTGKTCAASTEGSTPRATWNPVCSGGRRWDPAKKTCLCPADRPRWTGKRCLALMATPPGGTATPNCTGGRYWDPKHKSCRCPSDKPTWNGVLCVPSFYQPQPGAVTGTGCTGGRVWDAKYKACRCPSTKPVWNKKYSRCEPKSTLTGPPTNVPPATAPTTTAPTTTAPTTTAPTTTAPTTTAPKIVCKGGKMVGALCWCGIGKFPKPVGNNVYQCQ